MKITSALLLVAVCVGSTAFAADPCAGVPGTSGGVSNFDGSCTYDVPEVSFDGAMARLPEESATGFCALQGRKLIGYGVEQNPDGLLTPILSAVGAVAGETRSMNILVDLICR